MGKHWFNPKEAADRLEAMRNAIADGLGAVYDVRGQLPVNQTIFIKRGTMQIAGRAMIKTRMSRKQFSDIRLEEDDLLECRRVFGIYKEPLYLAFSFIGGDRLWTRFDAVLDQIITQYTNEHKKNIEASRDGLPTEVKFGIIPIRYFKRVGLPIPPHEPLTSRCV